MGPRPNGRGKQAAQTGFLARMTASMGPRPNGRGKRVLATADAPERQRQWGRGQTAAESRRWSGRVSCAICVNGAAAKRPRKAGQQGGGGGGRVGVNGAAAKRPRKDRLPSQRLHVAIASMGPRPNGRGKRACQAGGAPRHMRQWGRGQTAAESMRRGRRPVAASARQWGRGQTAAESRRRTAGMGGRTWRQWGRGQTAAERGRRSRGILPDLCVNGAAAKRPRKVQVRRRLNPDVRRVNGAAAKRPRKVGAGH